MAGQKLLEILYKDKEFKHTVENLEIGINSQLLHGIDGSQKNLIISGVAAFTKRPAFIVTTDLKKAEKTYEDLLNFFPEDKVLLFPARENIYHETLTHSKEITEQRLLVIDKILREDTFLVIAPLASLSSLLPPRDIWGKSSLKIKKGDSISLDVLSKRLVQLGYEKSHMVESRGYFSVRGGILDFFPVARQNPVRIEFFGDEVESIREFNLVSQRAKDFWEEVNITPVYEVVLDEEAFQRGIVQIEKDFKNRKSSLIKAGDREAAGRLSEKIENHLEKIKERIYFDGIEQYLPYFYSKLHTFVDYLPQETLFFMDEPAHILENDEKLWEQIDNNNRSLLREGMFLPEQVNLHRPVKEFLISKKHQSISFALLMRSVPGLKPDKVVDFINKSMPKFHGKWDVLKEEIDYWLKEKYSVFIMAPSPERGKDIVESCENQNIKAVYTRSLQELPPETLGVICCNLNNGFILPGLKLALLTEQEITPQRKKKRLWKRSKEEGVRISDYHELEAGDYVVHEHHGIGQYLGVRTLEINGVNKDYLYVKYAGEDKLFIPTDQINLVNKYIGAESKRPKLHSLGSSEWARVKNRVKESVEKLARELLSLYAARQAVKGHAFSPDHPWQNDFEARFPYKETEDQLKVIKEVKKDMEQEKPMDRLICGDVGYGKTEIALRAAFKAVMDGKQVAFLVPTTILAQQHYQSFKERFAGFPVNIEVLSRFSQASQQKEIIRQARSGWVDIIIGTHRLLSSDIIFKDLGLLIVDEEQRFGVRHKEKLKMLRENVDVITMTATPIPRTLHMSLVGVRDLSVIETPPEDRYPIQTYVVEYSETVIREAILRELNRGGQIYFVYNRVEAIEKWGDKLKNIVPEARIGIGHGQISESRLEKVMHLFLNQQYDILLSTTIVEAGLDIPNVNTMIIYDADKMGLAQLYQLRGRVGRSNRLAYAYLTFQKNKALSEVAEKRLRAIKEFTELGSGFKIALRDLEIRGAGNILGPEQHGFMVAVGFDLYCQLLEKSIKEMKGVKTVEPPDIKLEIKVNAFMPDTYIYHHSQKMYIYQKIASIESIEGADDIEKELNDRYGQMPNPVKNLIDVSRLKVYATLLNISAIVQEKDSVVIKFSPEFASSGEDLIRFTRNFPGEVSLIAGKQIGFRLTTKNLKGEKLLPSILGFCRELLDLADKKAIPYN